MSKCTECRKNEGLDTRAEKIASWIVKHVFPNTLKDETNASRLVGFSEGFQSASQMNNQVSKINSKLEIIEGYLSPTGSSWASRLASFTEGYKAASMRKKPPYPKKDDINPEELFKIISEEESLAIKIGLDKNNAL